MKQLLITFNVIFLLFGNIFFLNIHSTHDHDHHHEHVEQECLECLNIENNSNYIVESHKLDFSNNIVSELELQYLIIDVFSISRKYNSRSPPVL